MKFLSCLAAIALLAMASAAHAQINVVNTGLSGKQTSASGGGTDSFSFSYDNTGGEYLVVVAIAVSNNSLSVDRSQIAASFGGTALDLQLEDGGNFNTSYWAGIYSLAAPTDGTGILSLDFGTNIASGSASGSETAAWQFAALSLTNVDEANPITLSGLLAKGGETLTAPNLSTGDLFVLNVGAFNSLTALPNPPYQTPTDSSVAIFNENDADGIRGYSTQYAVLTSGDMSGASLDEVAIAPDGNTRDGIRPYVIFNSVPVPEPTGTAMLIGALGLLAWRQRSR